MEPNEVERHTALGGLVGKCKKKRFRDISNSSRAVGKYRDGPWVRWSNYGLARAALVTLSWSSVAGFIPRDSMYSFIVPPLFQASAIFSPKSETVLKSTYAELDLEQDQSTIEKFTRIHPPIKGDVDRDVLDPSAGRSKEIHLRDKRAGVIHYSLSTNSSSLSQTTSPNRILFRGLSTGSPKKQHKTKLKISERRGTLYSSTMPGFGAESDRLKAYRDGVRQGEIQSRRKSARTTDSEQQRKKQHGEALYRNCGAVPESLMKFADDIHKEDRITRKEEIELGELTQEAVRLQRLYERLKDNLQREPTDNEWCAAAGKINMMAIEQAIQDGFEAKNRLVASNLRIVQSVVNIYLRNGLSAQYNAGDMMQEGILALIRAAEKFEPDRGWKFSTYAMYWVRASVKRNQVAQSRPVPVPHRVYENHKRLLRTQRKLELSLGRKPSKKELGDEVGMSEIQVERCFKAMQQKFFSLDQEIRNTKKPLHANERNDRLVEIVEARVVDDEFSLKAVSLREAFVETLRRHLNPQEVELLMLRYGLKDCPGHSKIGGQPTIAELSRHVNLTPDRVRRIIKKALKILKEVDPQEWLVFKEELS